LVLSIIAVVLIALLSVGGYFAYRAYSFVHKVARVTNPIQIVQQQLGGPAPGTIAYKLQHGQRVNVLVLGYGGPGNDGPYLTDTMMIVSVDSAHQRIAEVSVPRDLYVRIDAWQDGRQYLSKINGAFSVPHTPGIFAPGPLRQQYQGRDGAGHLAETVISQLTGLQVDRYVGIDFDAFRSAVNAVGGVQVCMDQPLDDPTYQVVLRPGVIQTGIHFPAGCQQVNGEQALELARSRTAIEPEQATDYGRARRQQLIINAIRKKATSINAITNVLPLMDSLQNNFVTDMDLGDIKALYDFGSKLSDTATQRFGISSQDLVYDYSPGTRGSCGPANTFVSCPGDPTYALWHAIFAQLFVDPAVLGEKAPLQLVNGSPTLPDLQARMTNVLRGLGLQPVDGVVGRPAAKTIIYDYSNGAYPRTATWLQQFLNAQVVMVNTSPRATQPPPPTVRGQATQGLVVVLGADMGRRWVGQAP
jgi:LCP family protein required for cell wall assembly